MWCLITLQCLVTGNLNFGYWEGKDTLSRTTNSYFPEPQISAASFSPMRQLAYLEARCKGLYLTPRINPTLCSSGILRWDLEALGTKLFYHWGQEAKAAKGDRLAMGQLESRVLCALLRLPFQRLVPVLRWMSHSREVIFHEVRRAEARPGLRDFESSESARGKKEIQEYWF